MATLHTLCEECHERITPGIESARESILSMLGEWTDETLWLEVEGFIMGRLGRPYTAYMHQCQAMGYEAACGHPIDVPISAPGGVNRAP